MKNQNQTSRKRRRVNPPTRLSWPVPLSSTTIVHANASSSLSSSSSDQHNTSKDINSAGTMNENQTLNGPSKSLKTTSQSKSKSISFHPDVDVDKRKRRNKPTSLKSFSKSSSTATTTFNSTDSENQLWVDKYKPTNIKEICIAPKKIQEVRDWMKQFQSSSQKATTSLTQNYNNHTQGIHHRYSSSSNGHSLSHHHNSSSKLLVLVGSAGIGKSTLIHLLSHELHWNILEWNELHQATTANSSLSSSSSHNAIVLQPMSQLSSFEEFLSNAAFGWNIPIIQTQSSSYYSSSSKQKQKQTQNTTTRNNDNHHNHHTSKQSVILIDEIPNLHTKENEHRFRDILSNYLQKTHIPTVLIYSNVLEGKYNPDDLEKIIDPRVLSIPNMVRIIQINPVTKAKLKQSIVRIMKMEDEETNGTKSISSGGRSSRQRTRGRKTSSLIGSSSVSLSRLITDELIEELHTQSGGDIRHAIMTLQFKFVGKLKNYDNGVHHSNEEHLMNGRLSSSSSSQQQQQRDVKLSTFHALGKLLYAKRMTGMNANNYINPNITHLSETNESLATTTTETTTNPMSTYHNFHTASWNIDKRPPLDFNPEQVLDHSAISLNNALHFMGYHSPDFFTNINDLERTFSHFSDAALLMDKSFESINDSSFPNGYATSLISRSVADANKHPAPSKYRPLNAPRVYDVLRRRKENQTKAVQLCKKMSNPCLEHLDMHCMVWAASSSSSCFSLEYLPLLKQIIPNEVSSLSSNWYSYLNIQSSNNRIRDDDIANQVFLKELEKQKEILAEDDIIDDSSSDEMDGFQKTKHNNIMNSSSSQKSMTMSSSQQSAFTSTVGNGHNYDATQDSSKSEVIIIDSD